MTKQEIINEFIEKGADLEHARWAKWQKYMFSKMNYTEQEIDGKIVAFYVLPADLWERWNRQIDTPYSALSEQEKDSDRKQTKEYLPLLEKSLTEFEQVVREETIETCLDIVFAETYPFDGKVVRVFDDPNVAYKIIKNLLKN